MSATAFKAVGGGLLALGKAIGGAFVTALKGGAAALRVFGAALIASPIGIFLVTVGLLVTAFVLLYSKSETFRNAIDKLFAGIKTVIGNVITWLKTNWPTILAILTGPFGLAVIAIYKNWDKIVETVQGIPDRLKAAAAGMWKWLTTSLSSAWTSTQAKITEVVEGIKAIPGRIGNGLSNIWSGLTSGLQTAWDNAKKWWNANVASKSLQIGGATIAGKKLPSFTLGFPALAKGGIVPASPGGTLAQIGEAGRPERVEPLDPDGLSKRDKAMIQMLSGGAGEMTINVYPSKGMNESELANMVSRQIAFQLRRGGA
jgi:phage-related protein